MKISTLGFPQAEQGKLLRIMAMARQGLFAVQAFTPDALPDLLLVYGDAARYAAQLQALPKTVTIAVAAKQAPASTDYLHVALPLVASRVLRLFDSLAVTNPSSLAVQEKVQASNPDRAVNPSASLTAGQYRVLVVDDSLPMQQALALELRKLPTGIAVDFADSGETALAQVAGQTYDFIFLDIMMPGIDGFDTCRELRKRPELKKTPIIMLSSKTSPMDEVKGVIAGCTTYLTKPIVPDEFQKVMHRITKWLPALASANQAVGAGQI